jgi:DNA-binding CsgD family transcriptional regulator
MCTISGVLILVLAMVGAFGYRGGPYLGILGYLIFPAFFLLGLALVFAGAARARRRAAQAAAAGESPPAPPVIDFGRPRTRRLLLILTAAAAASVVVLSVSGYTEVVFMDKPTFCGSCHLVTGPEYAAYQRSPHARVECVACHIGSCASWFVKAKLSGVNRPMIEFDIDVLTSFARALTNDKGLTAAELREVIRIAKGFAIKDAAQEASVSPETIRARRKRVYKKLGVPGAHEVESVFLAAALRLLAARRAEAGVQSSAPDPATTEGAASGP